MADQLEAIGFDGGNLQLIACAGSIQKERYRQVQQINPLVLRFLCVADNATRATGFTV